MSESKTVCDISISNFERNYDVLKPERPIHFVEQKYKL